MLTYIFLLVLVFLATVGIIEICRFIIYKIISCNKKINSVLIIPFEGHCEDIEFILRGAKMKTKWLGKNMPAKIICLDNGMDDETRKICKFMCNDSNFFDIGTNNNLIDKINNSC